MGNDLPRSLRELRRKPELHPSLPASSSGLSLLVLTALLLVGNKIACWHRAGVTWGFPDGPVVKNPPASAGDRRDVGSIPGSERSPGEGNNNPLQYSCLENSTDRGGWRATVHGVAKSQTRLSNWKTIHKSEIYHLVNNITTQLHREPWEEEALTPGAWARIQARCIQARLAQSTSSNTEAVFICCL